ncbi:hypothetical protein UNDKW_0560 [Undibacterium sp. KW1]|uniref:hypothetical protein n=1 Tax=Undibacterium sp. KW1 TaxID=2058624 RepID=UPI001331EB70|nr:hypothetical protein UNDKW_0560 [Undibacterium sp. KW1]
MDLLALPLSGRAPFLLNWDEFANGYFSKIKKTGVVKSMKDFYWDIRPKPEYGTIELRVCDTPLNVVRAAALAAYLLERREAAPGEDDYLVYNYNRFQACRFGFDGVTVHSKTYQNSILREDILATLNRLKPHAETLDAQAALTHLGEVARTGNDAQYLRQQYHESGSPEGMVHSAIHMFRDRRRRTR